MFLAEVRRGRRFTHTGRNGIISDVQLSFFFLNITALCEKTHVCAYSFEL